jgi:hypothetical protein
MSKLKTPEEMNELIEKLNRLEIKWDDIPQELEKIRSRKKAVEANKQSRNKHSVKGTSIVLKAGGVI